MGSCSIWTLWLWPAADHGSYGRFVSANATRWWPGKTTRCWWWRSHMAENYGGNSTRQIINNSAGLQKRASGDYFSRIFARQMHFRWANKHCQCTEGLKNRNTVLRTSAGLWPVMPDAFCFSALSLLMIDSDVENDTVHNEQLYHRHHHGQGWKK